MSDANHGSAAPGGPDSKPPAHNPYAPSAQSSGHNPYAPGPQPPAPQPPGPNPAPGQEAPDNYPGQGAGAPIPAASYPPPGYPQPGYPAAGHPQSGYSQADYPQGWYPPEAPPQPPRPYHHALYRAQGGNVWRGVVAIILLALGFFLLQIPGSIVLLIESGLPTDPEDVLQLTITPLGLMALNLSLAALWPLSWGIQRMLYGARPGMLHSVAGRIRWRLFGILAAVLVPLYFVYVLASAVFFPEVETGAFTSTALAFILVAILTTPLQSAGEEVAFRGLLHRAVGGWFRNPRIALVIGAAFSSILFALAHGAGDVWLNAYYFVFGISMVVITWRTQGLEGAIIAHAANNTFLMLYNAAVGADFDSMFEREAGTGGPFMLIAMALCAVAAGLVWWRTRTTKAVEAMDLPENIRPNPWRDQEADAEAPAGAAATGPRP
ncbi:MAG TPA: type II CAAX endopeptidase family protein [Beutenbergiaceae bacterium]|nr:type II CAAX endopeptidase family protein [Beutenbergiaceae bacterium]